MMRAILRNEKHPEYGEVTIPFPIPADQYDRCIEMLEAIETGSILSPDYRVVAIGTDCRSCKGWSVPMSMWMSWITL